MPPQIVNGVLESWATENGFIQADPGQHDVLLGRYVYELTVINGGVGATLIGTDRYNFILDVDGDGHFNTPFDISTGVKPEDVLSSCHLYTDTGDLDATASVVGDEVDYGVWQHMTQVSASPAPASVLNITCNFKATTPRGVKVAVHLRSLQINPRSGIQLELALQASAANVGSQPQNYVELGFLGAE